MVRFATHDDELQSDELDRARSLLATCPDCRALASDVMTIANATAASQVPSRPRDFRISPEQAAALRGSTWRRFLRWLAAPGGAMLRPLAGTAVAIGLVLVLVGGTVPGISGGGTKSSAIRPPSETQASGAGAVSQDSATQAAGRSTPVPAPAAPEATGGALAPPAVSGGGAPVAPVAAPTAGEDASATASGKAGPQYAVESGGATQASGDGRESPVSRTPPPTRATGAVAAPAPDGPTTSPTRDATTAEGLVATPTPPPGGETAPAGATTDGADTGWWIILFGGLIAGLGLAVLLLTWLARRATRDPLLH